MLSGVAGFILFMVAGAADAHQIKLACYYRGPLDDMVLFSMCATRDPKGGVQFSPKFLSGLRYRRGASEGYVIGDHWYLVHQDGAAAPVLTFDNWAEDFSDGLARSPVGGKIGYVDRSLKLVIPALYDGAFRFEAGRAEVCIGCRVTGDREHSGYAGGRWQCIDIRGRLIGRERVAKADEVPAGICEQTKR